MGESTIILNISRATYLGDYHGEIRNIRNLAPRGCLAEGGQYLGHDGYLGEGLGGLGWWCGLLGGLLGGLGSHSVLVVLFIRFRGYAEGCLQRLEEGYVFWGLIGRQKVLCSKWDV